MILCPLSSEMWSEVDSWLFKANRLRRCTQWYSVVFPTDFEICRLRKDVSFVLLSIYDFSEALSCSDGFPYIACASHDALNLVNCTFNAFILKAGRPRTDVVCSVTHATRAILAFSARHRFSWGRVRHDWDCRVLTWRLQSSYWNLLLAVYEP